MDETVIRCRNLGKFYRIVPRENYKALRDVIARLAAFPLRAIRLRGPAGGVPAPEKSIWALDDISFDVRRGEILGVIGRNGAGKSTLLKILSRITKPTRGAAEIRGRVGSLLEVGTGFHQELTGRENIRFNGALLGMRRREIERRLDAIVEFAGLARFIDSPVKHYSSGMYMRLAFAVAAHLDTEVLLVDEVLAVGDIEFQQKCLGKMHQVAGEGRTVLLVSHNISAVRYFCSRCMLLEAGRVAAIGPTDAVVDRYLSVFRAGAGADLRRAPRRQGDGRIRATHAHVASHGREQEASLCFDEGIRVTVEIEAASDVVNASLFVLVRNLDGAYVLSPFQTDFCGTFDIAKGDRFKACILLPHPGLLPGSYLADVGVIDRECRVLDWVESAVGFAVMPDHSLHVRCGSVAPEARWTMERIHPADGALPSAPEIMPAPATHYVCR